MGKLFLAITIKIDITTAMQYIAMNHVAWITGQDCDCHGERMNTIDIGEYKITCVRDTEFALDASTLFHMIPRVLWEKKIVPDELHRVFIGLNCLLIRGRGRTILYDAGVGNKLPEKLRKIHGLNDSVSLMQSLARTGVSPEDIDTVVLSHLHFDHAGWSTIKDSNGNPVPAFPNAGYIVQNDEWKAACNPSELNQGSYLKDDFLPLEKNDCLRLVDGDTGLNTDIRLMHTPGHSPGHQCLLIKSGNDTLFCPCELIPSVWHLRTSWATCYDDDAHAVVRWKKELMARAAAEHWTVFLSHDPAHAFGRLTSLSEKEYGWESF